MATKEANENEITKALFTKEQLLASKTFRDRKDALAALLDEDKTYTIEQAQGEIVKFMKGKVN